MKHVVLLGDSIFDNAVYVPGKPSVHTQLQNRLPNWRVTLLARDGDVTLDIPDQLRVLPADASHLVLSCGGNDALENLNALQAPAASMFQALQRLADIRENFEQNYQTMLQSMLQLGFQTAVCTIYESVPGLDRRLHVVLCLFNDVIIREANRTGAAVIDLRLVCTEPEDYSEISPIEPSSQGGEKIVDGIAGYLND
jgi:hypothetical protein